MIFRSDSRTSRFQRRFSKPISSISDALFTLPNCKEMFFCSVNVVIMIIVAIILGRPKSFFRFIRK